MDLAIFKKDDTPPVVYRQRLLELMSVYYDSRSVFTDGSKTDNGVGSAVYTDGVTLSWILPHYASVYTAETYALCQALKLIKDNHYNKSLVLTDSLSAIMALRDQFSTDPMVINIFKILFELRARGQGVTFVWVPGHIGVSGNERADQAAKQAASTTSEDVIPTYTWTYFRNTFYRIHGAGEVVFPVRTKETE
ncbi:ribonuclease H1-like [Rhodnius prolixus]|uniref:ribonuclease H1-like n=1 Tax=Rhodnius prolixus TaxID=13249 RepID=UPI003D18E9BF